MLIRSCSRFRSRWERVFTPYIEFNWVGISQGYSLNQGRFTRTGSFEVPDRTSHRLKLASQDSTPNSLEINVQDLSLLGFNPWKKRAVFSNNILGLLQDKFLTCLHWMISIDFIFLFFFSGIITIYFCKPEYEACTPAFYLLQSRL